mgnify:CR=1 FL=1|jgi:YesN/AraC family two-component response regulator
MYKLLIADDEPIILIAYKRTLNKSISGLEIECANNGQEALVKFLADPNSYDLVITDNNMPKMTGMEFLENIQKYNLPKILISGTLNYQIIQQAEQYGISKTMEKPFESEDLIKIVQELLGIDESQ